MSTDEERPIEMLYQEITIPVLPIFTNESIKISFSARKTGLNKEEAIEFARKYLADRENQTLSGTDTPVEMVPYNVQRAWNIAVEYILHDIIPYLYGEALD